MYLLKVNSKQLFKGFLNKKKIIYPLKLYGYKKSIGFNKLILNTFKCDSSFFFNNKNKPYGSMKSASGDKKKECFWGSV